jgi:hypothetical protein
MSPPRWKPRLPGHAAWRDFVKDDRGPGVPEAIPRTLQLVARSLGAEEIDRLWVFPPLIRGRKEWGLVTASCFADGGARRLYTAQYLAERSGTSLTVDVGMADEGQAPPDRFPRVMIGVVRRSQVDLGEPRTVEIAGDPDKFQELMNEFDPSLMENSET